MLKVAPRTYGHKSKFFRFDGYDYLYAARAASPAINYLPRALTLYTCGEVSKTAHKSSQSPVRDFPDAPGRSPLRLCNQ